MFNKPFLVIAHRGASLFAPENTMPAFKLAADAGADMIETDIQLTKDGVPVLFHDKLLNKHSTGKGLVPAYTYSEIRKLDAGKWFSNKFKGEKIPSLQELLIWAKQRVLLNIEIKTESVSNTVNGGVEERVIQLVRDAGMTKNVLLSSFDYRAMGRFKKIDSSIKTGLLYNKKKSGGQSPVGLVNQFKADAFHCSARELNNRWMKELRQAGIPIMVYTINRKRKMRKMLLKGISGVFSDNPKLLKETSDQYFYEKLTNR